MRKQKGISLIEIMVALVVGSLTIAGAVGYYVVQKRLMISPLASDNSRANSLNTASIQLSPILINPRELWINSSLTEYP